MSGGTDTSTSSTSMPGFVQPYAQNYLEQARQVASQPYQAYGGQTTAQLNPYQTAGYNAQAQRAMNGSQVVNAASGETQRTLSGGYLGAQANQNQNAGAFNPYAAATNAYAGSNPYLSGMIDSSAQDVVRNYNDVTNTAVDSAAARSGSFGNSGIDETRRNNENSLQKNLANLSNQYRFQDYTTQQGMDENRISRLNAAGSQFAQNQFGAGQDFASRQDQLYNAERNRQMGAVGSALPLGNQDYTDAAALQSAGQGFKAQDQANLTDQYNRFTQAQQYPQQQLDILGKAFTPNYGSTSTQSGPSSNPWAQGLGAAASTYGLFGGGGGGKS